MFFICAQAVGQIIASELPAEEWRTYGRDHSQQRYSPLDDINTKTVEALGLKWSLDLPSETALVSTPLMVGGFLYFSGKFAVVYAVDARNGRMRWSYDPKSIDVLIKHPRRLTINVGMIRGVAYADGKVYVGTPDGRLIAINARTGEEVWSTQTFDPATPRYISGAPLAFNGKVLIGHGGADFGPVRGYVTAYDGDTGAQVWRFHTVPGNPADGFEDKAMEMAAKTWTGQWWKYGGGGTVWNAMTYDPEFNRVYLGTGNGSPWNQGIRSPDGGDNLFLASIVALDADTGEYVWHYQQNPGETWDFNSAMDLVLAELVVSGKRRKALMHAPKNGFFYVIDRETGKLISAESFVRTTWASKVDLATGRPIEAPGARPGSGTTTIWPGPLGGHNWPPMSYSPSTGLVYIPVLELAGNYDARGVDPRTWNQPSFDLRWSGYTDTLGRRMAVTATTETNVWGDESAGAYLQARDPVTNTKVWQLKQPGVWAGGTLTTRGGLVFIGQANGFLIAYDARSGVERWKFDTYRPITAPPISYEQDGVQYVSVLVGWGGTSGTEGSLGDPTLRMRYRDGGRRLLTFALNGRALLPDIPSTVAGPIEVPGFVIDPAKVQRGEELFDVTCAICHGSNAISGGGAPDLRESRLASDPKKLEQITLDGILSARGMPKYVDYSPADIEAVYHYIRSQARKAMQSSGRH